MLIYTGWYICLLVMIIFKGRKLIKGRKMDFCAAQRCNLKLAVVATLSTVLTPKGAVGVARMSRCWLVAEAHLLCHGWPLCPRPHPCTSVPIAWRFGGHPSPSLGSPLLIAFPPQPLSAGSVFRSFQRVLSICPWCSEGFNV